jgi:hypothetical protein
LALQASGHVASQEPDSQGLIPKGCNYGQVDPRAGKKEESTCTCTWTRDMGNWRWRKCSSWTPYVMVRDFWGENPGKGLSPSHSSVTVRQFACIPEGARAQPHDCRISTPSLLRVRALPIFDSLKERTNQSHQDGKTRPHLT